MSQTSQPGGRVILLPHPKGERAPARPSICEWPKADAEHRRKFLRAEGSWVDSNGSAGTDWLEFWTEYEAPTRTESLPELEDLDLAGVLPRYVHEISTDIGSPTLNSDPWVFRPGFVWTICRHRHAAGVNPGDLVLFGSSVDGEWVVDTVMTIDCRLKSIDEAQFDLPYRECVLSTLPVKGLQPFIGSSFLSLDRPFSFVPARIASAGHAAFARLRVTDLLRDLVTSTGGVTPSAGNERALAICKPTNGISEFWRKLRSTVGEQRLVFGASFRHPGVLSFRAGAPRACSQAKSTKC